MSKTKKMLQAAKKFAPNRKARYVCQVSFIKEGETYNSYLQRADTVKEAFEKALTFGCSAIASDDYFSDIPATDKSMSFTEEEQNGEPFMKECGTVAFTILDWFTIFICDTWFNFKDEDAKRFVGRLNEKSLDNHIACINLWGAKHPTVDPDKIFVDVAQSETRSHYDDETPKLWIKPV